MLGRTDSWPFGRARRGFAFILGSVVAVLLLQGQTALAQEAQSTPPSADDSGTAGSTASPSPDSGTSSTTVAAPQAAAAASPDDPPSNPASLRPSEEVDGANASFTTSVPLQVPPFHGLEPQLALAYDSGRGNGLVGVGWTLAGLSAIERGSVRRGAPRYDTTDAFYLDGAEMVVCTGISTPGCSAGGTHATRIESFLRIKQVTASNSWEVTRRDGTKLTYGALSTWCSYNSGNSDEVKEATNFRWALRTAVDTHGNTVTYAYTCDGVPNQYIDTISYNGNSIKFYREARTDDRSYATGAGLGSWGFRLKTVDVKVGASRVRAYTLTYSVAETARSRLASVQQFGKDAVVNTTTGAVTGGTSLPAIALTQSATQIGYDRTSWGTWTASTNPAATDWLRGDFNGDGKDDMAQLRSGSGCVLYLLLSTGTGFTQASWTIANCPSSVPATRRLVADVT